MQKDGILVAEYWTSLPSKKEFEEKIRSALRAAKERADMTYLAEGNLS
jgi:hypothetical protein